MYQCYEWVHCIVGNEVSKCKKRPLYCLIGGTCSNESG